MPAIEVTIDDLQLDLKNPRFGGLANQPEALERIVFSQGRKLVNLADDIASEGLSPVHRMLVVRGREKGKFIVLDGNRRLTALKILANPTSMDGMGGVGDSTKKQLKEIAKTFDRTSVEPIDAFLVDNEAQARHWIEAIHTGENEGRGVVDWDGIATARFRGQSASLKAIALVQAKGNLSEAEQASLAKFSITNLDRLLGNPDVRDRLGLVLDAENLHSDVNPDQLVRALKRIVTDIGSKKVKVGHIHTSAQQLTYMDSIKSLLPDLSKRSGVLVPIDSIASGTANSSTATARSRRQSKPPRKTLIPADPRYYIDDAKIEDIYGELRKLPLESYPHAIAVLARVFIELSCDHIGRKNSAGYSINLELKKKIDQVADALQRVGIPKSDLKSFRRLASAREAALNVDRLHNLIHSQFALPTPSELRTGWNEIHHAFVRMWAQPASGKHP